MKVNIIFFLYFNFICSWGYILINPTSFSIVREDYVKFNLQIQESDPKPDSVFFEYFERILNKPNVRFTQTRVKADEYYSYLLNLKNQVDKFIYVRAQIWKDGKMTLVGIEKSHLGQVFCIDRNTTINPKIVRSKYIKNLKKIKLTSNTDTFICNNNSVAFSTFWNYDSLCIYLIVKDKYLNTSLYRPASNWKIANYFKTIWDSDGFEISFDLKNDKKEFRKLDDIELVSNLLGNYEGYKWDEKEDIFMYWGKKIRVHIEVTGTINNNTDIDSGYKALIMIPWTELNINPNKFKKIGFDLQIYDRDSENDYSFRRSFSGMLMENNDNTSEWSNLILERKNKLWILIFITFLFILGLIIFLNYNKKYISDIQVNIKESGNKKINDIKNYIDKNYSDSELDRNKIASDIKISENYLSSVFKQETGISLVNYINIVRTEKAKELLKNTNDSISEIAYKTGFNSPQSFNRTFKLITHLSPSEFKQSLNQ